MHFSILIIWRWTNAIATKRNLKNLNSISTSDGTLSYTTYGFGRNVLLAFHGYAQQHDIFKLFSDTFPDKFKVYSFDIFLHGKSSWHNNKIPLTKAKWTSIISLFLEKEHISSFGIIGYSMGGKFAITIAENFPDQCRHLLLLAPDGIRMNFWYKVITQYYLTRLLFEFTVKNPTIFLLLKNIALFTKMVPAKLLTFSHDMMDSETKRLHVYNTWMIFRLLYSSPKKLDDLARKQEIRIHIFVGKYDVIVKPASIIGMCDQSANLTIHTINSGHGKLIIETIRYIKSINISL